jgi:hypothetical protein
MSKVLKAALLTAAFALFVGQTAHAQVRDSTQAPAVPGQPSVTPSQPSAGQPAVTTPPADQAPTPAGPAVAENVDHHALAVKHVQAAVDAGKTGSASGVADHAQEAMTHVQAIAKDKPSDDISAAQKSLEEAVSKGKSGDADGATKAAQDALVKLQKTSAPKQN